MKPKKARWSPPTEPHTRKLPPDPDGTFNRAAARGEKVIAMYENMYPDPGRDFLISNLLHDLMHLCDRDPTLGDFHEEHGFAVHLYEELVEESRWMAGEIDDPKKQQLKLSRG